MFNCKGGYNLSDIAAATRGNGNDGMFGDNGWWIILLFLFAGWGGRGFGGFGGGGGGYELPCATQADVRAAVDQQTLISKLDQQTYGLADSTYALTSAITNGFHGVDTAVCTLGYNMQGGFNTLGHQISDCCCENGRIMERGFADLGYALATQACDTRQAIANSTRDIIESNTAGVRSILDFLTQDKIATLTAENQSLKFAASQAAQNAYLVSELRPCPVPAYTVANPYCCNTYFGNCG
jgi:hypothetical protein